jgi:hypothetical protein
MSLLAPTHSSWAPGDDYSDSLPCHEMPTYSNSLPYQRRLRRFLSAQRLPNVIDLGGCFDNAGIALERAREDREDFDLNPERLLAEKQLRQLGRQLRNNRHITDLDLSYNSLGPDGMRLLAGPIASLAELRHLNLEGKAFIMRYLFFAWGLFGVLRGMNAWRLARISCLFN